MIRIKNKDETNEKDGVFSKVFNLSKHTHNEINIRPKFLRSKSIDERSVKIKKPNSNYNTENSSISNKKKDNEINGLELFAQLEKKFNSLIDHFKPSSPGESANYDSFISAQENISETLFPSLPLILPTPSYLGEHKFKQIKLN